VALDTHNAASFWNKALLDNSARPSGALVYAGPEGAHLTDEQFSRLKEELEENFSGATNAGRPLLLEGGLDWKALSLSPKDMDFTESKAGAAREIALAFGVPPLLRGLPGDNTFSNYAEANRAFWRQTVLPLVERVQKSFQAWLQPGFEPFRLDYNADRLEAFASERASEWERVGKAAFLTLDEQREALGYGPAPKEALVAKRNFALERRYSPDQPRVPAGNSGAGQWTSGGGGGESDWNASDDSTDASTVAPRLRTAQNENRDRYVVKLNDEEDYGHTIERHVGKSDDELLARIENERRRTTLGPLGSIVEYQPTVGSFDSKESANDFVNRVLEANT
jgi:hypothetical protein